MKEDLDLRMSSGVALVLKSLQCHPGSAARGLNWNIGRETFYLLYRRMSSYIKLKLYGMKALLPHEESTKRIK